MCTLQSCHGAVVAPLSDVPHKGSSVFSLFSLIKLHLVSLPLASSYQVQSCGCFISILCPKYIVFGPNAWDPVKLTLSSLLFNTALLAEPKGLLIGTTSGTRNDLFEKSPPRQVCGYLHRASSGSKAPAVLCYVVASFCPFHENSEYTRTLRPRNNIEIFKWLN